LRLQKARTPILADPGFTQNGMRTSISGVDTAGLQTLMFFDGRLLFCQNCGARAALMRGKADRQAHIVQNWQASADPTLFRQCALVSVLLLLAIATISLGSAFSFVNGLDDAHRIEMAGNGP
jgi:hypothetical protein